MYKLIPIERIENKIYLIRNKKVMIDDDLAVLYQVKTKALMQAVKRNIKRFPEDFAFQLTLKEAAILRSQIVTSSWGGRRYLPYVFTEQGVAMLSSVLRSQRAIEVNILIVRAFVKLREVLSSHEEIRRKIEIMEKQYDTKFQVVFQAIKTMIAVPKRKHKIGFLRNEER